MQRLLSEIRELSEHFIFQQDSAPAHRARETVGLLKADTPEFIPPALWPPNSPDLSPVDYTVWSVMQEKVDIESKTLARCVSALCLHGTNLTSE